MPSRTVVRALPIALFGLACSPNNGEGDSDAASGRRGDGAISPDPRDATVADGGDPGNPNADASHDGAMGDVGARGDAGESRDGESNDVTRDLPPADATTDARSVDVPTATDVTVVDAPRDVTLRDAVVDAPPDAGGGTGTAVSLDAALRFKRITLRPAGSNQCLTVTGTTVASSPCGGAGQDLRAEVLGPGYVALVDDASGGCLTAQSTALVVAECTHVASQQFSFSGAAAGYQFVSLESKLSIGADWKLANTAAKFELHVKGNADALAVVVDERPIGWAAVPAKIVVPTNQLPTGNEMMRDAPATTGGGTWEAARAKNFANVTWFKPADFAGTAREMAVTAVANALKAAGPSILLFEEGTYDFALSTGKTANRCNATCSAGGNYTQVGGFCPDDATCASTAGCVVGGFSDPYRMLDVGSDKTILGLGAGAVFRRLGLRFMSQHNVIYRNVSHREMPGNVRAWDDGLLFWPADHVWVDHVSFSGFGRGAVVLSGTRVADGSSFYAWHDSGWMTFSWIAVDSSESWRCANKEDSPYPFFTTNDPSLTFHHALFLAGHGRNPAIDGESAHFFNCSWSNVSDGLDGRGSAKLLVEGSWFDGDRPIRMDDPLPPVVLAPIDPKSPALGDPRRLNLLSTRADTSLRSDWKGRGLDVNTLNTNSVPSPSYPYSLDLDPTRTQAGVAAGAGVGKAGFPVCSVTAGAKTYVCQ